MAIFTHNALESSESNTVVVPYATDAEIVAGTATEKVVHPLGLATEFDRQIGAAAGPTRSVSGTVQILDFGNSIVRMSGFSSGVNFVDLPISLATVIDVGCTVQNSGTWRGVHLASVTGTRINFTRNGGTGAAFRWFIFGVRA